MPVIPASAVLPRFRHRWAAVVGLLVLSPISAEYLIGYGESTGRPLELLAGLLILAPLYGTVAVLIREITRRTGRGWPTILLLSAAFGVIQAGLIDQTLFDNEVAADDPDWATQALVTLIPGLGVDAASLLNYVGGHVIWSFAAPIAVVESCAPRIADRRWLGPVGVGVMVLLWALSAALIFNDTAADSGAGTAQLIGAALVAIALIAAAFTVRPARTQSSAKAPPWWLVGGVTGVAWCANQLLSATWAGVTVNVVAMVVLGWLLLHWSRRRGWGRRHVLAVAGSALVVRAGLSFLVEPLGNNVDGTVKYAVNAVMLGGVAALLLLAAHRLRRQEPSAC
ncbi:hypothetical protein [Streptomyces europaeiscabiei]|uniref:hypothetical protein n=1 Tax=Streptomyces europaeiscabiei TaxID=146819 RepID=UPI0029B1C08B|nr:hypothetical protein [Streptomyces europaeiscabiei]MDX2758022.1 hypothetical protein [Streptomyces europaeiscabiei]